MKVKLDENIPVRLTGVRALGQPGYRFPRGLKDGNIRLTGAPTPRILPLLQLNFLSFPVCRR